MLKSIFIISIFQFPAQPKKRKNNDNTSTVTRPQQKNTVAILNELRQGLIYKLESQTGPVHAPIFRMSVVVSLSYQISLTLFNNLFVIINKKRSINLCSMQEFVYLIQ